MKQLFLLLMMSAIPMIAGAQSLDRTEPLLPDPEPDLAARILRARDGAITVMNPTAEALSVRVRVRINAGGGVVAEAAPVLQLEPGVNTITAQQLVSTGSTMMRGETGTQITRPERFVAGGCDLCVQILDANGLSALSDENCMYLTAGPQKPTREGTDLLYLPFDMFEGKASSFELGNGAASPFGSGGSAFVLPITIDIADVPQALVMPIDGQRRGLDVTTDLVNTGRVQESHGRVVRKSKVLDEQPISIGSTRSDRILNITRLVFRPSVTGTAGPASWITGEVVVAADTLLGLKVTIDRPSTGTSGGDMLEVSSLVCTIRFYDNPTESAGAIQHMMRWEPDRELFLFNMTHVSPGTHGFAIEIMDREGYMKIYTGEVEVYDVRQ